MTITLITGGNKGLGRETARRLIAAGHTVVIGARDHGRGVAAAEDLGAHRVQLDVTDQASVTAAMDTVAERLGGLDVLVNNAGIADNTLAVEDIDGEHAARVLDTNVAGVIRVTQAALPLLRASAVPVVVNVGSGLGSFWANTAADRPESQTPLIVYAASKAALAMLTLKYSQALPDFRINAACPGLTDTDFAAGFPGAAPVTEAADVIVRMATIGRDGPTGTLVEAGGALAW